MRIPAALRSTWDRAHTTVRRRDALGWSVPAGVAIVALLGALVLPPRAVVVGAGILILIVVALFVRVVHPVRSLARETYRVANETLPATVATLDQRSVDDVEPELPPISTRGSSEVVDLAAAVTSLQATALSLVAEQHRGQRRVSELTTHLERRNQTLLNRLTTQIAELTTLARDRAVLDALGRLDHIVARTRRNAESMLVLTGAVPARTSSRPATVADVLRAALAQVEDHARVDVEGVEPTAVSGSAVADLAHLVAELVENATHFSPPGAHVGVTGASDAGTYVIRVTDHGVGMPTPELDEANRRIRDGAPGPSAKKLIGLDVVGRLAARHGITVVLAGSDDGLVVTVTVPEKALAPLSELPAPRRPVTTLAAAAAFIPPRSRLTTPPQAKQETGPRSRTVSTAQPDQPTPTDVPEFVRPGVPRRVRGAQLPDLGPDRDDGPHVTPDAGRVRGRLGAFQAGLSAARTNNIPPLPRPQRGMSSPRPGAVDSPPAAPASRISSAQRSVDDADES
jgi:signal transduction histidine kinase